MSAPSGIAKTPFQAKRDEILGSLSNQLASYPKKQFEAKAQEIAAATPDNAIAQLTALTAKVAKSQQIPIHGTKLTEAVGAQIKDLAAIAEADKAAAADAAKAAAGAVAAPAAAPAAVAKCPLKNPPLGFKNKAQFDQAMGELRKALDDAGIKYSQVGVRGSSVIGFSQTKGTNFSKKSDIDVFFIMAPGEAKRLGLTPSKTIPGLVLPAKIAAVPSSAPLQAWSAKWKGELDGRDISAAGFTSSGAFGAAAEKSNQAAAAAGHREVESNFLTHTPPPAAPAPAAAAAAPPAAAPAKDKTT
jgi:hypothetical protein